MPRPFILLATVDTAFEVTAINAILDTHHGVRCVHDMDEVYWALHQGTQQIALAIVDTSPGQFGRELVHALNGLKTDFPVLAVDRPDAPVERDNLDGLEISAIPKSTARRALAREIRRRCAGLFFGKKREELNNRRVSGAGGP